MENRVSLQVSGEIICFSVSFIHCWKSDYKNKTWKCFLTPKVAEAFPSDGQRPLCACSTFKVLLVGAIHFGEEGLSHFVELWRWMFPLTFLNSAEFQSPVSHQIQNQLGLNEVSHSPLLKLMCEINTVNRECSWVGCWWWYGDTAHREWPQGRQMWGRM